MLKEVFCNHQFVKDKNNLYCPLCGKYKRMKCDHKFKSINQSIVTNHLNKNQVVETFICEICGDIIFVNHTTQSIEDNKIKINVI